MQLLSKLKLSKYWNLNSVQLIDLVLTLCRRIWNDLFHGSVRSKTNAWTDVFILIYSFVPNGMPFEKKLLNMRWINMLIENKRNEFNPYYMDISIKSPELIELFIWMNYHFVFILNGV